MWKGALTENGYGTFYDSKMKFSHRVSYEHWNGKIPNGLQINHICRNRSCCNPQHLEAVTQKENILCGSGISAINSKKTHCKREHELTIENVNITVNGSRSCKKCESIRSMKSLLKNPIHYKNYRKEYVKKHREHINYLQRLRRRTQSIMMVKSN